MPGRLVTNVNLLQSGVLKCRGTQDLWMGGSIIVQNHFNFVYSTFRVVSGLPGTFYSICCLLDFVAIFDAV